MRAQQEVDRRAAAEAACNVAISLQELAEGHPVMYKLDGQRFEGPEHTLKLQEVRAVPLRTTMSQRVKGRKPWRSEEDCSCSQQDQEAPCRAVCVHTCSLHSLVVVNNVDSSCDALQGHRYQVTLQLGPDHRLIDDVAFLQPRCNSETSKDALVFEVAERQCTAEWTCPYKPSAKGVREMIELAFAIDGVGMCRLPLNVKVYGHSRNRHAVSGWALKSIMASFKAVENVVKVTKEQWLAA